MNWANFCWSFEVRAVQKHVNIVDLVKSSPTSIYYLLANIGVDTAENEPLKVHLIFKLWDSILTDPAGLPRGAGARAVHVGGVCASSGWRAAAR